MGKLWNRFLDVLYPRGITCDVCGGELTDGDDRFLSLCPYCYGHMEVDKSGPTSVAECDVYSLFKYESVRDLILRCKDGGCPYLATTIGRLLYRFYVEKGLSADAVCYIPCGKKAYSRRGYDHMELVAKEFSAQSGLPLLRALERVKETSDQTEVDASERYDNVRGSFVCKEDLSGKNVLLLDDLITTGATLSAAIHAINDSSFCFVRGLTLGKA